MPKLDITPEIIDSVFDRILAAASKIGPNLPEGISTVSHTQQFLRQLKYRVLSDAAEEETKMAATEFTLDEAVEAFNLTYTSGYNPGSSYIHYWSIQDLPETKNFSTTHRIETLLENYSINFDRSSEAACRTGIDFVLNECLTVMKGDTSTTLPLAADPTKVSQSRTTTPNRWEFVKIHCEVPFSHHIDPNEFSPATTIDGRVDYGIGVVLKSRRRNTFNRRFHSLMLVVEAKHDHNVGSAVPQLVVYLACLRQSRLHRKRSDASVYGLASDGFGFIFVTITHEGILKLSNTFNILVPGQLEVVLGCLEYVLTKTADMTPTLTPEKNSNQRSGDKTMTADEDEDEPIQLDDNDFLRQPTVEDEWSGYLA